MSIEAFWILHKAPMIIVGFLAAGYIVLQVLLVCSQLTQSRLDAKEKGIKQSLRAIHASVLAHAHQPFCRATDASSQLKYLRLL